jgi:NADP-dependent 3-hydroxy acid dehydrogenase YdfG
MGEQVCLITGVGPGTGAALARRFARGGYRVAMLARSAERLDALAAEIAGARAFQCDVTDAGALEATCAAVASKLGPPRVVIHNAVGGAFGDFQSIDPGVLRHNFEVNTMALLTLARAVAPAMVSAGEGAILCTGNTSAHRGVASFAGFAPSKAAQRILAESIARSLWPRGVHVAYVTIDAVIDLAWTRQIHADKPDDFFITPDAIADECWHTAHQPRAAWSFDVQLRPFGERW